MITKKPFTKDKLIHIGFFAKELEQLPFYFLVLNDKDENTYEVTPEIKARYPPVKVTFNDTVTLRHEIPMHEFVIPDYPVEEETDESINLMTIRDFYSIIRNVPASQKDWLNKLINLHKPKSS